MTNNYADTRDKKVYHYFYSRRADQYWTALKLERYWGRYDDVEYLKKQPLKTLPQLSETPEKSKMPTCGVFGCENTTRSSVKLFKIPAGSRVLNRNRRQLWLQAG